MAEVRRRWGDDETAEEEKVKRGGWNGWGILPGCQSTTTVYPSRPCLKKKTSIILNLGLSGWGFHLHFPLIRAALVKIQTSGCSILLFLVLLPGAMASIKHNSVVRTL